MGGKRRARRLRKDHADAERLLGNSLRAARLGGFKFRRPHPLGRNFVDFICLEQELLIEMDGDHHAEQAAYDDERGQWIEGQNLRILRFSNRQLR